jgi:acyl-coenzyme A thioesterase PaaI-like protein
MAVAPGQALLGPFFRRHKGGGQRSAAGVRGGPQQAREGLGCALTRQGEGPLNPQSLQERYAPGNACFGCGHANAQGLRIKSYEEGDAVVAHWRAQKHHEAFPGVLNGGIVGALLDCHSNWAALVALMQKSGQSTPPCTVTADFHVTLRAPTPSDAELQLWAKAVEVKEDRAIVEATLSANGKVCARCRGTFVAVKPGHPAHYRW